MDADMPQLFQQYPMVDVIEEAFYISFDHKP